MVSARKKRLNKESDFHKPKLKVGKRLPKNLNVTKIDLQTKKLIIKSQLKSNTGGAESTVDKKKRNIAELLIRVCHMNEKMRIDAVTSLDEILFPDESSINQLELMRHLSAIVRKLCVVLCDVSVQVRKLVCSLFSKICSAVSEKDFEGLFDLFMAHLCNALTHVDEAIQKSALILLYQGNLHPTSTSRSLLIIRIYSVPPPPRVLCFLWLQLQMCCYIARYYVKIMHVRLGVIKHIIALSWGWVGDRIDSIINAAPPPPPTSVQKLGFTGWKK